MPAQAQTFRHLFGGGWATDFGPSADVAPNQAGDVIYPFLIDPTENIYFELDGGPHKIGGASKLNSTVVESGARIRGLFDFWRQGTTAAPSQKRVIYASTKILADAADGVFVAIKTGLQDDKVPCFTVFNDKLILSSDSTVDVPMTYDQTSVTNLGGTPPQFSFSCVHKNRVWAAGVASNPSRLYYSKTLDGENWTDSTAGSIDIDPNDGDRITGIASHKNDLWVFKGPYRGSIHRITGSANSGTDSFARITFINGIGAVGHNTLFKFRDDLGFVWSDGTIHSLAATAAYGDFNESALSRPIHRYIKEHVTNTYLARAWTATDVTRSMVLFAVPVDGSTFPNQLLVMDYSRQSVWWMPWPALNACSVARVIDPTQTTRPIIMIGGSDGFVRKTDRANRAIDSSTAISAKVTMPYTNYGNAMMMKTLGPTSIGIAPKGSYSSTFGWTRDNNAQQTATFAQSGGDVLAPADAHQFTLGTSQLGGATFIDRFMEMEEGGEFRSISYQITDTGTNQDLELHSFSAQVIPGAASTEN